MNKKNKILVGCLALLLVLSVGYALFSETIEINGTATAKGNFVFETTCSPGDVRNVTGGIEEGGYGQESCVANDNMVTLSTELLYPSALRMYTIEMKNTGTIDGMVELTDEMEPVIKVVNEYSLELYRKSDDTLYQSYNLLQDTNVPKKEYGQVNSWYYTMLTKEGDLLITDELILNSERLYENADGKYYLRVKPGDTLIWNPFVFWDKNAEQTEYYSKFKFNLDINIEQFVEDGLTPATYVESCYRGC